MHHLHGVAWLRNITLDKPQASEEVMPKLLTSVYDLKRQMRK